MIRKYINENDPSPFMGEIKKMSFHADNMDLPISFQRKITQDGEVQLMRSGGIDYVKITAAILGRFVLNFISEQDGKNVRSGISLIHVYDSTWIEVAVTIKESVSGETGNEKYTYFIDIPKTYGTDGSGGTSGEKNANEYSKYFISFGIVTENHIGHVICLNDFADYDDWHSNGGIRTGTYTVKVPYFLSENTTNYSAITTPNDAQSWEYRSDYHDYVHGSFGADWAVNYLGQYNCINNPKRPDGYISPASYSRIQDSVSATTAIVCSASVRPAVTAVLRVTDAETSEDVLYQYYRDDNGIEINRYGYFVENYERYVSEGVLKSDYWLYDPKVEHTFSSDVLSDLGYYNEDIPGFPGRTYFDALTECLIQNTLWDVTSGNINISYSAIPVNSYCGWNGSIPFLQCRLKYLCKKIEIFTNGSYSMKYVKNI